MNMSRPAYKIPNLYSQVSSQMPFDLKIYKTNIGFSFDKPQCTTGVAIGGQKMEYWNLDFSSFYVFFSTYMDSYIHYMEEFYKKDIVFSFNKPWCTIGVAIGGQKMGFWNVSFLQFLCVFSTYMYSYMLYLMEFDQKNIGFSMSGDGLKMEDW